MFTIVDRDSGRLGQRVTSFALTDRALPQHRLTPQPYGTHLTVSLKSHEVFRRRNLVLDNELGDIILANIGRSTSRTDNCTALG